MWVKNLKVLAVAFLVIGFYTAVAHLIPQLQSEVPEDLALGSNVTPEALAAAGEKVFNGAGGCTACHGLGSRAPNLLTDHAGQGAIGARCGTREPGKDCKAYLYESLTNPGVYIVPGFGNIMPDMRRQLQSEDQIWALVAFLQSQGGEITVTGADIPKAAAGGGGGGGAAPGGPAMSATMDPKALFAEKGCVGCHILEGTGGAVGPSLDKVGGRLKADQIRKKILDPRSSTAKGFEQFAAVMPATFGQMFSAGQLEVLVQFLAAHK